MKKSVKKRILHHIAFAVFILFYGAGTAAATATLDLSSLKMPNEKATIGSDVPNVKLFDSSGKAFNLKDIMGGKPLIVSMVYTRCPSACGVVTDALRSAVKGSGGLGRDFNVLSVSFDKRDKPENLEGFRKKYGFDGKTWMVASGDEEEIKKLAAAIDFRYIYDPSVDEFLHPNMVTMLTPEGRISRYIYGMTPRARDLRLASLEAKKGSSSFSIADGFYLKCFKFDPATRTYNVDWTFVMQLITGITSMGGMLLWAWGRELLALIKKVLGLLGIKKYKTGA